MSSNGGKTPVTKDLSSYVVMLNPLQKSFFRPELSSAWNNLGILLNSQKRFEEAERCYSNAVSVGRLRKKKADYLYNLGNMVGSQLFIQDVMCLRARNGNKIRKLELMCKTMLSDPPFFNH